MAPEAGDLGRERARCCAGRTRCRMSAARSVTSYDWPRGPTGTSVHLAPPHQFSALRQSRWALRKADALSERDPSGSNSVGRVSASQAECRRFESGLPLHFPTNGRARRPSPRLGFPPRPAQARPSGGSQHDHPHLVPLALADPAVDRVAAGRVVLLVSAEPDRVPSLLPVGQRDVRVRLDGNHVVAGAAEFDIRVPEQRVGQVYAIDREVIARRRVLTTDLVSGYYLRMLAE